MLKSFAPVGRGRSPRRPEAPSPWSRDAGRRTARDRTRRRKDGCPRGPGMRSPPFLRQAMCGIAVVPAARTLGEIAAEGGEMPDLRRRQTACRGGDAGISRRKPGVGRDRGDGRRRADARRSRSVPGDPGHAGGRNNVDERTARDAAAAALREVGARGAELGLSGRRDDWRHRRHAAVLRWRRSISRSGRIGISYGLTPIALRIALAIAADVGTVATSPMPTLPPRTCSNPPSSK